MRINRSLVCAMSLWIAVAALGDETTAEASPPVRKTVRLLMIGNSFSKDATRFLPQILQADGRFELVQAMAYKGGASLQAHWDLISANDGKARPYGGKNLRQLLESEPWDIVSIQQASALSHKIETYQPYAGQLVGYIREHAPTAKIWMHETWAYRADDTATYRDGFTQEQMHERLREAYHKTARDVGITTIVPVGDAFQAARQHPAWLFQYPDPAFDYANPEYPNLPDQTHSLNIGYQWKAQKEGGGHRFAFDTHHANKAGQYLGSAVWFELLFGESILGNTFVPQGGGITADEVLFLQEIAHKIVADAANTTQ